MVNVVELGELTAILMSFRRPRSSFFIPRVLNTCGFDSTFHNNTNLKIRFSLLAFDVTRQSHLEKIASMQRSELTWNRIDRCQIINNLRIHFQQIVVSKPRKDLEIAPVCASLFPVAFYQVNGSTKLNVKVQEKLP